jgi:leucyl-tRNA synthetase
METDTLDTFVDSSWYYLRFLDPRNSNLLSAQDMLATWMPVDVYIGGIEHAIMHLLYARFINRSLADIFDESPSLRSIPAEPFKQLICQGLVEGKTYQCPTTGRFLQPSEYQTINGKTTMISDGQVVKESWDKMSKSKYNGVDPSSLLSQYGSDALRLYMLFKAPPEIPLAWSEREIVGPVRWLERLDSLTTQIKSHHTLSDSSDKIVMKARDEALRKVDRAFDLKTHNFNTAVAALMKLSNIIEDSMSTASRDLLERTMTDLSIMLFPMAPSKAAKIFQTLTGRQPDTRVVQWPKSYEHCNNHMYNQ